MKKLLLLFFYLILLSAFLLTACKSKEKTAPDNAVDIETTEEPFDGLDFEEEVTIPLEENEGVGGL